MALPEERFSDRVDDYVRFRPSYPPEVVDCLRDAGASGRESEVADVGSGTGIFTALLLPWVRRVTAVEPNDAMRAAAERRLGSHPGFRSVRGTAGATTLPDASVDLVTAAQAFHWFAPGEARAEFARILRPGGAVALVWNERLTDTSPFLAEYDDLLRRRATDYDRVNHTRIDRAAIAAFFAPGRFDEFDYPYAQEFDLAGLTGRALSSSYVPNRNHPDHPAFLRELESIFRARAEGGRVRFEYATRLYLGSLDPDPAAARPLTTIAP